METEYAEFERELPGFKSWSRSESERAVRSDYAERTPPWRGLASLIVVTLLCLLFWLGLALAVAALT